VAPEVLACEDGVGQGGIPDEAASRVRVEAEEKGDEEVVDVPERLEGLLPDFGVRGGVHHKHAKKHDVSCNAAGFGVVNLNSCDGADLRLLDIEEIDVMSGCVDNRVE